MWLYKDWYRVVTIECTLRSFKPLLTALQLAPMLVERNTPPPKVIGKEICNLKWQDRGAKRRRVNFPEVTAVQLSADYSWNERRHID